MENELKNPGVWEVFPYAVANDPYITGGEIGTCTVTYTVRRPVDMNKRDCFEQWKAFDSEAEAKSGAEVMNQSYAWVDKDFNAYYIRKNLAGEYGLLQKRPGRLGAHKVKSKNLPWRNSFEEAFVDAIAYAEKHKLHRMGDGWTRKG